MPLPTEACEKDPQEMVSQEPTPGSNIQTTPEENTKDTESA